MKILLIQPKMNMRPMDTDLKTRMAPSLALLTLKRLTPKKHDVTILNENMETIDFEAPVDMVGITVTLDVMPRACEIAAEYRGRGVAVVAGGIHVTCCPEECEEHFDAICIGAAERVWAWEIEDAEKGCLKKIYCDMEGFDGEEIASPEYEGLDERKYLYTNVIHTSRGCPNRCDFCYNSCTNRSYVLRPVDDVLKDIHSLKTRHILFVDDNFIGTPAYTKELLNRIRGLNLRWGAAVTTQILKHLDLLDLMAQTGCHSLFIGFESINDASLLGVHKQNRFAEYETLIREIHARGIMINASMVFGLDGDHVDVFRNTVNWLVRHKVETLTSHILTPYPGTVLHARMAREKRIIDHNLSKYNTANVVFMPRHMTPEQLYEGYLWVYKEFYSFRNIYRRMPKDKRQMAAFLMFNLLYRKFGRFTAAIAKVVPMRLLGKLGAWLSYRIR